MSENTKRTGMLLSLALIALMVFQILIYREYAFEATWLYAKEAARIAGVQDKKKLGAICNSLARSNCSARIFSELVKDFPGDVESLSNLAMALVGLKEYQKAEPYFKAYFADGGAALDVMYWYGKSLRAQGKGESSIPWFYNVLYYNMSNELASRELFDVLHSLSRTYEAQSLLASLQAQAVSEELKVEWQKQYNYYKEQSASARGVATSDASAKRRLSVPALDGRRFYLPIKNAELVAGFMNSVETELETQISASDLLKYSLRSQKISPSRVLIKSMHIGPFEVTNFEAKLCESCESVLGGKLLSQLSAHIDGRGKVPYLIIHEEGDE